MFKDRETTENESRLRAGWEQWTGGSTARESIEAQGGSQMKVDRLHTAGARGLDYNHVDPAPFSHLLPRAIPPAGPHMRPLKPDFRVESQDDEVLAAAVIAGDPSGVATVRRWIRAAAGRYRRLLASDLEDLEQEILVGLIAVLNEGRFQGDSKLETYVSRMVHYKCIDRLRAASRRDMVDIDGLDLPAEERSALNELQCQEVSQLALRVAASQSEACRELWAMLHEGMSYSAMATKVGVAPGTLRVRVLRCRRKAIEVRNRILEEETGRAEGSEAKL